MPHRLEIAIRPDLPDAEGRGIQKKARDYFDIKLDSVRVVQINTLDVELTPVQCDTIRTEVFTNPITQVSSFDPLPLECHWIIWVGIEPLLLFCSKLQFIKPLGPVGFLFLSGFGRGCDGCYRDESSRLPCRGK